MLVIVNMKPVFCPGLMLKKLFCRKTDINARVISVINDMQVFELS